jgi:hypothetical protein
LIKFNCLLVVYCFFIVYLLCFLGHVCCVFLVLFNAFLLGIPTTLGASLLCIFGASLLCVLNTLQCLLTVCFWCYSLPNCCVILMLFGVLLFVHSWCFSTPPCYEFLVLFIACLLCAFSGFQCFLVAHWWCSSVFLFMFLVSSPPC